MSTMMSFISDKPIRGIRFHRFQPNQSIDNLWVFDETVERFEIAPLLDIPTAVVIPDDSNMIEGTHWEIHK